MTLPFDLSLLALGGLAWALTYAVHSTILLGGAWLLERRFAERPELMSPIWKAAVLGGAFSATLQLAAGLEPLGGRWSIAAEESVPVATASATTSAPRIAAALASQAMPVLAEVEPVDLALTPVLAGAIEPAPSIASAPVVAAASEPVRRETIVAQAAGWFLALWIVGGLAALLGLLRSWFALRRALSHRIVLRKGTLVEAFTRLQRRVRGRRAVQLSVCSAIHVPLATGVVRPEVVVPQRAVAELGPAAQQSMLAHELAHVVRRDPTWRLVVAVLERVLFFQPLLRIASRRIAQHAEYLADAWAARQTAEPLALARCLTEIAAWIRPSPALPLASSMAEPASILGRRVLRLVEPAGERLDGSTESRRARVALVGALAVVPVLAWIAPGASWAHDDHEGMVVIADGEPEHDGDIEAVVIDGGRARIELDALQHREDARAATDRSDEASPKQRRRARKAARAEERQRNADRRQAERDIERAFDRAKKDGRLPNPDEIAGIVARAHAAERARDRGRDDHGVVVLRARDEKLVVRRDGDQVVVKRNGKVVLRTDTKKRRGRDPHDGAIELRVLDDEGHEMHIHLDGLEQLERFGGAQGHVDREMARAMREVDAARAHVARERARAHIQRERIREEVRRHLERRGHAPRPPAPPHAPHAPRARPPRVDIVPIAPAPMPPTPPVPPEAVLAPHFAPPAPPAPHVAPVPRPAPAPRAAPAPRRPRAAPVPGRAPQLVRVVDSPSA